MKNQFLMCVTACLMLSCLTVNAQESDTSLTGRYERETIYLHGNFNRYCKNNIWHQIGATGQKIDKEFTGASPQTKEELKKYRRHRRAGIGLAVGGGAVMITAIVAAPVIVPVVFFTTLGGSMATYYVGAFHLNRARRQLNKAVWQRNRDVLAKKHTGAS